MKNRHTVLPGRCDESKGVLAAIFILYSIYYYARDDADPIS